MTLLFVVVVIAVVAGVAVLVVRDQPVVGDDPVDPRRLVWPAEGPVGSADVQGARFTVALRGYRMDEVDLVLADVAAALADRDARIAALESGAGVAGASPLPEVEGAAGASSEPSVAGPATDGSATGGASASEDQP